MVESCNLFNDSNYESIISITYTEINIIETDHNYRRNQMNMQIKRPFNTNFGFISF